MKIINPRAFAKSIVWFILFLYMVVAPSGAENIGETIFILATLIFFGILFIDNFETAFKKKERWE